MGLYDLLYRLIDYAPSGNYYSWETYYLQGAIALVLILVVVIIDLLYRFINSIIRK